MTEKRFVPNLKCLKSWWRDLNPQPTDYKSVALPLSYTSLLNDHIDHDNNKGIENSQYNFPRSLQSESQVNFITEYKFLKFIFVIKKFTLQIDFHDDIVKMLQQKDPVQILWSILKRFLIIKVLPFICIFLKFNV